MTKIKLNLNDLPRPIADLLRLAYRAKKLAENWEAIPACHPLAENLLADAEKLKAEATDWPPEEERLGSWVFPEVPETLTQDALVAFAKGLESLAYLQVCHGELCGSVSPTEIELEVPEGLLTPPRTNSQMLSWYPRRVPRPGRKYDGVL
jgi:hypothetical protein